ADVVIGLDPGGKVAQVLPAIGPPRNLRVVLELRARPETSLLGPAVEVERLIKDGEVVIAHQADFAPLDHQIQAFHRVRAVPDDVAEADDLRDASTRDLVEHDAESFKVAVDVTDDREHSAGSRRGRARCGASCEWYGVCQTASNRGLSAALD